MKLLLFMLTSYLFAQALPSGIELGPNAVATLEEGEVPVLKLNLGIVQITQPITVTIQTPAGTYELNSATAVVHARGLISSYGDVRWKPNEGSRSFRVVGDFPAMTPGNALKSRAAEIFSSPTMTVPHTMFSSAVSTGTVQLEFD